MYGSLRLSQSRVITCCRAGSTFEEAVLIVVGKADLTNMSDSGDSRADAKTPVPMRRGIGAMGRRTHNLRAQPTHLVGRAGELKLASQVLLREDVRLVTFTGPAGTGKTRLSLALAESMLDNFPEGVYFVDLARTEDPTLVAATIAESLGVRETRDQPLMERLQSMFDDKQVLLVLDNFEHILSAADQVADLLALCPGLKILVTSRAALRLRWEHVFPVFPLPLPARGAHADVAQVNESSAVQLFVERARAADPAFELTEHNAATVAEVCMRLDGLPLAIELAAARSRSLPPEALLNRLRKRLDVLVEGARDLPVRQRTLREAIRYSYDLLDAGEQALFSELAVFAGGCTLDAANAIVTEPAEGSSLLSILDGLESLVNKSLLQRDQLPSGEVRFRMLETIREYAQEQLARSGGLNALRDRWLDYLLGVATDSRKDLLGRDQSAALDLLELEHDNLRAALRWCIDNNDVGRGLRLGAALWRFWYVRGFFTEGRTWLAELLSLPSAGPRSAARANALSAAGNLAFNQGDDAAAESLQQESLAIRRELGDRPGVAASLDTLGTLAYRRGDSDRATAFLEESLLVKREQQDRWGVAAALHHLGDVAVEQGNFSTARARYQDSLQAWHELGDAWSTAMVLESFAQLAHARGHSARALNLVGAASAARERLRATACPPVQRLHIQRLIEAIEGTLGRDAANAAIAEGRVLDLDQAIALARAVDEPSAAPAKAAEAPAALPAQGPLAWLTPREREVAALLLRGMSNRMIAEELVITERTAETHVCRILSKLGLDSRAQIAAWIIDNGLLENTRAAARAS
jgi:predicted ATPase/DNA-binding NarL/FixJ family response regulator